MAAEATEVAVRISSIIGVADEEGRTMVVETEKESNEIHSLLIK